MSEQPQAAVIEFSYRNVHNGWCDVTLTSGTQSALLVPSYLTDALRDLLLAARDVLLHDRSVCLWANEPGTIELLFARRGGTLMLRARMLGNDDLWFESHDRALHEPSEHAGRLVFDASGDALAFTRRVAAEAELVLEGLGAARYEEEWGYPFPADALRELRMAIEFRS